MELSQIPNLIYYAIPFFILTVIIEGIAIFWFSSPDDFYADGCPN